MTKGWFTGYDIFKFDTGDSGDCECEHKWKAIIGLYKIYYNCVYCDIKKERIQYDVYGSRTNEDE